MEVYTTLKTQRCYYGYKFYKQKMGGGIHRIRRYFLRDVQSEYELEYGLIL